MNLKTLIHKELWQAISKSYESGNYKNSITDATQYLTDLLREKTGLDLDGTKLVGEAFGGDTPRIKINKYQTTSEKDEQRGFLQLLNGIYTAIRNPRSHERKEDLKSTADAIIYFIDYLCREIDKSKISFTIDEFLERVFDPHFVPKKEYAKLLIEEIPPNRKTDVLIEIFRNRLRGEKENLNYITNEITSRFSETDADVFMRVFSDELKNSTSDAEISTAIGFIPREYWTKVQATTKMRIENMLLQSMAEGEFHPRLEILYAGALGTWVGLIVGYFTLTSELRSVFWGKLNNEKIEEDAYIFKYFLFILPIIFTDEQSIRCICQSKNRPL